MRGQVGLVDDNGGARSWELFSSRRFLELQRLSRQRVPVLLSHFSGAAKRISTRA